LKSVFRIFAAFLFLGAIYSYVILRQSPETLSDINMPIGMAIGALACTVLSIGGNNKYDPAAKKTWFLKTLFLLLLLSGYAVYYFFFMNKP
jgi:hypothetical protein